jgi:hypothetical protein
MLVEDAVGAKTVDVRRLNAFVAVDGQAVRAKRVDRDDEDRDVGGGRRKRAAPLAGEKKKSEEQRERGSSHDECRAGFSPPY